ncbi:MAG TPA: antibiotic biosynthesis monooxygenase [Dehalococcoidia bacterium]|nr:antibiotic biosynthesis monooxygenase [Dehalococcoidia bacterium]
MIQVQEMLVVAAGRESEAAKRLESLFDLMAQQPSFRDALVGRGIEDPSRILVLHAWERLEDWTTFQASEQKTAFSASRPSGLYEFEVIGMNWQLEVDSGVPSGAGAVRRTVYKEGAAPSHGSVVASRTARYLDDEPRFQGATLQLSYYDSPQSYKTNKVPVGRRARAYLADEGFELVASRASSRNAAVASAG